jgi:hypothetical protein
MSVEKPVTVGAEDEATKSRLVVSPLGKEGCGKGWGEAPTADARATKKTK